MGGGVAGWEGGEGLAGGWVGRVLFWLNYKSQKCSNFDLVEQSEIPGFCNFDKAPTPCISTYHVYIYIYAYACMHTCMSYIYICIRSLTEFTFKGSRA